MQKGSAALLILILGLLLSVGIVGSYLFLSNPKSSNLKTQENIASSEAQLMEQLESTSQAILAPKIEPKMAATASAKTTPKDAEISQKDYKIDCKNIGSEESEVATFLCHKPFSLDAFTVTTINLDGSIIKLFYTYAIESMTNGYGTGFIYYGFNVDGTSYDFTFKTYLEIAKAHPILLSKAFLKALKDDKAAYFFFSAFRALSKDNNTPPDVLRLIYEQEEAGLFSHISMVPCHMDPIGFDYDYIRNTNVPKDILEKMINAPIKPGLGSQDQLTEENLKKCEETKNVIRETLRNHK